MNKIGYLCDDSILPLVGNDPYSTNSEGQICNLVTGTEGESSKSGLEICCQSRGGTEIFVEKKGTFPSFVENGTLRKSKEMLQWIQGH
jgi:hypothetical protein